MAISCAKADHLALAQPNSAFGPSKRSSLCLFGFALILIPFSGPMFNPSAACWLDIYPAPGSDQSFGSAGQGSPPLQLAQPKAENPLPAPVAAAVPLLCPSASQQYSAHHHHQHYQHSAQLASFVQSALGLPPAPIGGPERGRAATKKQPVPVPAEKKDTAYKERRRKNNASARKSRELRRKKEEETQLRNAELEAEIARLRQENYALMAEVWQLKQWIAMAGKPLAQQTTA